MKAYELLFFVDPASNEEVRAGVMKRIDVAITENGGQVDSVDDWGKRKPMRSTDSPRVTTPSSTSMPMQPTLPSLTASFASTTQ